MIRNSRSRSSWYSAPFVRVFAIALFLLCFFAGASLLGQQQPPQPPAQQKVPPAQPQPGAQPPQAPAISVESNIVRVFATVREKHGQIVNNLTKDDFTLDEDGRPQAITYFARENDLPLTVGLLVDTSLSQRSVLDEEKHASATFIDHVLREEKKDQAFLIHFDFEVELLQDFTSSRKKLESALDGITKPTLHDAGNSSGGGHHHGGTTLYDAVYLASDDMMKKISGRKAVVILSDGVDHGSKETIGEAIEAAQRANTVVYSIYFKGEEPSSYGQRGGYGGGGGGWAGRGGGRRYPPQQEEQHVDGKKILDRISRETGGRMFEAKKKQPVDQIYAQIEQELRDQYILGYVPDKSPNGTAYRKIHLVTKNKDLTVQARDGYYADQRPSGATGN